MADPTVAAPPSAVAPAAPSPGGDSQGADSFLSEMMEGVETPETPPSDTPAPKAEPKSEAKPADKPAAKPPVKPEAAKPDPDKTVQKPEKPREDMNQLRRRHDELLASEKRFKTDIAKLQEENKALASKRFITPEIEKEFEENKKEIGRLKGLLSESAYENSDEYKAKYTDPWQRTIQSALAMVDQMQTPADEDNGVASRKTTSADLQRVMTAPVNEQAEVAQKLFGVNALRILTVVEKLNDLRSQADADIKSHRETAEGRMKQFETWQREQARQFQQLRENTRKELTDKYPAFFAPDEADPESSEALAKGFEFVDRAAERHQDMTPDERAAYAEVIRARAAWFTRGYLENNRLKEKVKSLEAELAGKRKSDPGAAKEAIGDTKPVDEFVDGIDGLAAEIEKAARS